MPTAKQWDCTSEEYHAATEVISNSGKELFRRSQRQYHQRYVMREPGPPPTRDMQIGIWAHLALWQPEVWLTRFVVAEKFDRRTKIGKEQYAEWLQTIGDKHPVDLEDYILVNQLREAVLENKLARAMVEAQGPTERSITWTDEITGLKLKCRPDKWLDAEPMFVDLKTTGDVSPAAFARMVVSHGYHRNADFYLAGHRAIMGVPGHYLFIVVSKQTFEVACYELDDAALDLGYMQNRDTLERLARCYETDDWLSEHEKQITTLSLPGWAYTQDDYQL